MNYLKSFIYNLFHTLTYKCEFCGAIVENTGGHYGTFGVSWCYFPDVCPKCKK